MKQFFKFMFASMVGFVLSGILLFILFLIFISAAVSSMKSDGDVSVKNNSVLEIKLDYPLQERTSKNPFEGFDFKNLSSQSAPGLDEILKSIHKAKSDDRIKGIFLNLSDIEAGFASVEEIRNSLLEFKESKKFIYAYSEEYSQKAYYLSTVADKIYLNPAGTLDLKGLAANLMFFKGSLEKLEIEPEIIRHGKFKSAVEPFMYDRMSPENREQINTFISSIWNHVEGRIGESRKLSADEVQKMVDDFSIRDPETALNNKLIDQLAYFDEVQADLGKLTGNTGKEKANMIALKKYSKAYLKAEKPFSSSKIAVIYAAGDIVSGKGQDDEIGSDVIAEAIRKARTDSSIKAIVLRVNSPGGSALASEVIWRETVLAKKAKPLIVSMGDYAASGGYYISCAADTIVAQPNTLTGSIGVFGLLFNAQKMFNNKLGVTFDTVKTGRYADLGTASRPMSSSERSIIQAEVEKIYSTFVSHVSEGRHMDPASVDSIGQGRVWSGEDAKRLGLVDALGGINDAIEIAARAAKLDNYRILALPEQKEFIDKIFEDMNTEARTSFMKNELGDSYRYYFEFEKLLHSKGVQARIPYILSVE